MKRSISSKTHDKPKFLADECLGLPTILLLRRLGYSVVAVPEINLAGKPDFEILKSAVKEKRVLVTEDIDFGNITLYPPKFHAGIILLRFRRKLESDIHNTLTVLLGELRPADFNKTLIIVDADKYRLRRE